MLWEKLRRISHPVEALSGMFHMMVNSRQLDMHRLMRMRIDDGTPGKPLSARKALYNAAPNSMEPFACINGKGGALAARTAAKCVRLLEGPKKGDTYALAWLNQALAIEKLLGGNAVSLRRWITSHVDWEMTRNGTRLYIKSQGREEERGAASLP